MPQPIRVLSTLHSSISYTHPSKMRTPVTTLTITIAMAVTGNARAVTYQNPIIPGFHPDPSCVFVPEWDNAVFCAVFFVNSCSRGVSGRRASPSITQLTWQSETTSEPRVCGPNLPAPTEIPWICFVLTFWSGRSLFRPCPSSLPGTWCIGNSSPTCRAVRSSFPPSAISLEPRGVGMRLR